MQRVTNCVYLKDNQILLLKKPRRGWWAIPGGKMEPTENIKEAVQREYKEETGLQIIDPELKGVYTFLFKVGEQIVKDWMMFTFVAKAAEGTVRTVTEEGILQWHPVDKLNELPMAEGDQFILQHAISDGPVSIGTFEYNEEDHTLLSHRLDQ